MGLLIYCSTDQQIEVIAEQINIFFNHTWNKFFYNIENTDNGSHKLVKTTLSLNRYEKSVIQYMLNIVDVIRLQRNYYKSW